MSADTGRPQDAAQTDGDFLRRWSRRKHAARTAVAPPVELEPPAQSEAEMPAAAPAPVLTDRDMPPVETLDEHSDYGQFLSPGVSEELRRQALRVLFRLPQVNTRCPLDSEYYDCTHLTPLGSIVTHEMREALEREAKEKLLAAASGTLSEAARPASAEPPPASTDPAPTEHESPGEESP